MIEPNYTTIKLKKKKKTEPAGSFHYQAKFEHHPVEAKKNLNKG